MRNSNFHPFLAEEKCMDRDPRCRAWARWKYCTTDRYKHMMMQACRRSCAFCVAGKKGFSRLLSQSFSLCFLARISLRRPHFSKKSQQGQQVFLNQSFQKHRAFFQLSLSLHMPFWNLNHVKNRLKAASKRGDCCLLPRRRDEALKNACVRGLSCYRVKKEKFSDHNSLCILETHDCKDKVASRCPRLKEEGYCKSMDPDVRLRMRNMCAMTCNFCRKQNVNSV